MKDRRHRIMPVAIGVMLASTTLVVGNDPEPATAVAPTIVTIEWHDGNADQVGLIPILRDYGIHATFLVNTGPILAHDPSKLSEEDLKSLFEAGHEIAGHTLDHVNVQPLPTTDARNEVCTDRNNLLSMGRPDVFQPTSLAYPFASFDAASEDVAHYCGYNGASATAGLTLKGPVANTVPPADPYAVRTVPAIKKSTKLTTMQRFVEAAEVQAQADGTAWTIFVFHHLCGPHEHCGAVRDLGDEAPRLPRLPPSRGHGRCRGRDDATGHRRIRAGSVRSGLRRRVRHHPTLIREASGLACVTASGGPEFRRDLA